VYDVGKDASDWHDSFVQNVLSIVQEKTPEVSCGGFEFLIL
jgi:hypothetical protein